MDSMPLLKQKQAAYQEFQHKLFKIKHNGEKYTVDWQDYIIDALNSEGIQVNSLVTSIATNAEIWLNARCVKVNEDEIAKVLHDNLSRESEISHTLHVIIHMVGGL